jgi:hypothetical protein
MRDDNESRSWKIRGPARIFLLICLIAGALVGLVVPANATNYVVCGSLYYYAQGGGPYYIVNNDCRVETAWTPTGGSGPQCVLDQSLVKVCWWVEVATPID